MAAATAADGDSTRICSGTLSSTLDLEEAVYRVYGPMDVCCGKRMNKDVCFDSLSPSCLQKRT